MGTTSSISVTLKRHDTAPSVELLVYESDGTTPKDLSGYTATFSMGAKTSLPNEVAEPTDPFTVTFPNKTWVQTVRVGDECRIESNVSDEILTVSAVDYQTGEVTFDRGVSPAAYYPRGATVWFLKLQTQPALVDGDDNNKLVYEWVTGDTDRTGVFWGEFEVTAPAGSKRTYPAAGYVGIRIIEDIDDV
jgi:hypothetical protein